MSSALRLDPERLVFVDPDDGAELQLDVISSDEIVVTGDPDGVRLDYEDVRLLHEMVEVWLSSGSFTGDVVGEGDGEEGEPS